MSSITYLRIFAFTLVSLALGSITVFFPSISFAQGAASTKSAYELLKQKYGGSSEQKSASEKMSNGNGAVHLKSDVSEKPKSPIAKYSIQVGSFGKKSDAQSKSKELEQNGHVPEIAIFEESENTVYRVFVGKFQNARSARLYLASESGQKLARDSFVVNRFDHQISLVPRKSNTIQADVPPTESKSVPVLESQGSDRAPASTTAAVEQTPAEKQETEPDYGDFAFGDWLGAKQWASSRGIDVNLRLKEEFVRNLGGGKSGDNTNLGNVDITVNFDLEKLAGLNGLRLFLYGLENHGGKPSEFIGDALVTSNIEAPSTFKIYEAYLEKSVDDRFSILFGLRDLNADFYSTSSSGNLVNSTFGIGSSLAQTGVNGPSIFPTAAPALTFKYVSPSEFYFKSGVFNGQAGDPNEPNGTRIPMGLDNGFLNVIEIGTESESEEDTLKFGVGAWMYSKAGSATDTSRPDGQNAGFYLVFDKSLSPTASVFLRHGLSAAEFNQFSSSTEVGIKLMGLFPGRANDALSVGAAGAFVSSDSRTKDSLKDYEGVFELNYRFEVGSGISIQPDFQYVKNPGAAQDIEDAKVGSVRFEVNF